jgi:hypothetical protein
MTNPFDKPGSAATVTKPPKAAKAPKEPEAPAETKAPEAPAETKAPEAPAEKVRKKSVRRTAAQIAQENYATASLKTRRLAKNLKAAEADVANLTTALESALKRRDFAGSDPDLPDGYTEKFETEQDSDENAEGDGSEAEDEATTE